MTETTQANEATDGQSQLTEVLDAATSPSGMTYLYPEEMRHNAEEYEACMMAMDGAGVPRASTFGAIYSIWGRAQWMAANVKLRRLRSFSRRSPRT